MGDTYGYIKTNRDYFLQQYPELASIFKPIPKSQSSLAQPSPPRKKKPIPAMPLAAPRREGNVITLTLPLPPRELQPNVAVGLHWTVKGRAAKTARTIAGFIANQVKPPEPFERARIDVTLWLLRKFDPNNVWATLKHTIDGLQDAGLFVNDSDLETGEIVQHTGKASQGKREVQITITQVHR